MLTFPTDPQVPIPYGFPISPINFITESMERMRGWIGRTGFERLNVRICLSPPGIYRNGKQSKREIVPFTVVVLEGALFDGA